MRIQIMIMVPLAIAALACGDRTERRMEGEAARQTPVDQPSVAAEPQNGLPTASDQPENPADRELVATIRQNLMGDDALSTAAQNVTIVAEGGNVTLRGRVETMDEKNRIEAAARQAPGVHDVNNQIEVAS